MTLLLYAVIYAAALICAVACASRAFLYARAPLHLRWEIYPVPHGKGEQLRSMLPEMLFLRGLWEFNRKLWYRSFPFHFGLYLLLGTAALVLFGALTGIELRLLYRITGSAGAALVMAGALGLLHKRLSDPALRPYTTPGDLFNLVFFLVTAGVLTAGYLFRPPEAPGAAAFVRALLRFDTSVRVPGMLAAGSLLAAVLSAYIPMTHMSHFIAKYFTYHAVRWDDRENVRGGAIERQIAEYLTYRPTWAAPHVGADGARSWAEVATTNPARRVKA